MLPVDARSPLLHGHDDLDLDSVAYHEIPSDIRASKDSAGKDDLLSGYEGSSQVADCENVKDADGALRFSAGAFHAPSLASQGLQHS